MTKDEANTIFALVLMTILVCMSYRLAILAEKDIDTWTQALTPDQKTLFDFYNLCAEISPDHTTDLFIYVVFKALREEDVFTV